MRTETDTDADDVEETDDPVTAGDVDPDDPVDPVDPPAGDEEADEDGDKGGRLPKLPQLLLTAAVALLVTAVGFAGWYGVAWFRAADDDSLAFSKTREDVVRVAQVAIATMNTLDYRKVDQGLDDWENVTTGELNTQVVQGRETSKEQIVAAQSVTKATVLSAGVVELDDRAGQASVLVALRVNVQVKDEKPVDKYRRLAGKLQRTDDGWKLYEIGEVPYSQPGQ